MKSELSSRTLAYASSVIGRELVYERRRAQLQNDLARDNQVLQPTQRMCFTPSVRLTLCVGLLALYGCHADSYVAEPQSLMIDEAKAHSPDVTNGNLAYRSAVVLNGTMYSGSTIGVFHFAPGCDPALAM